MPNEAALQTLERIYAKLPKVNCQRKCFEVCGPVAVFPTERRRMEAAAGYAFDCSEHNTCRFLDQLNSSCKVYAVRPLICRIWGAVKKMACPHGCKPDRWLTDDEVRALYAELTVIDGPAELPETFLEQLWLAEQAMRRGQK